MSWYESTVGRLTKDMELHFPGYQFCGPGTKYEERVAAGQRGINELDNACMEHDKAYHDSKDPAARRKADEILEKRAFQVLRSSKASLSEKGWAILTGVGMHAKRRIGFY